MLWGSHLTQGIASGGASGMYNDDTSDSHARLAASLSCCCLPAAPCSAGETKVTHSNHISFITHQ